MLKTQPPTHRHTDTQDKQQYLRGNAQAAAMHVARVRRQPRRSFRAIKCLSRPMPSLVVATSQHHFRIVPPAAPARTTVPTIRTSVSSLHIPPSADFCVNTTASTCVCVRVRGRVCVRVGSYDCARRLCLCQCLCQCLCWRLCLCLASTSSHPATGLQSPCTSPESKTIRHGTCGWTSIRVSPAYPGT